MSKPAPPTFQDRLTDVSAAVEALRAELKPILDRILPVDAGARSCARSLGVSRTNGWRCWALAHTPDPANALRSLPGRLGWKQLLAAFERHDIDSRALDRLQNAIAGIDRSLKANRLDKVTLRALSGDLPHRDRSMAPMKEARRASRHGNARIYGVEVKHMISACLVTPDTPKPDASTAWVTAFDGLVRSRPGLPWPIRYTSHSLSGPGMKPRFARGIGSNRNFPTLLEQFSTPGIAGRTIRIGSLEGCETVELTDLDHSDTKGIRAIFGEILDRSGTIHAGLLEPASLFFPVLLPTRIQVCEVVVHPDFLVPASPSMAMYGTVIPPHRLGHHPDAIRLPLESEMEEIDPLAAGHSLGDVDHAYAGAMRAMGDELGLDLASCRRFRVSIPDPPMFSRIVAHFEITRRPAPEAKPRRR